MPQIYEPEFKKKIVRLHLEDGRTYKSLTQEYGVSKSAISKWVEAVSYTHLTLPTILLV